MHLRLVNLSVKPDQIEAFKQASLDTIDRTVREPGVISFAFLQQVDDPAHFTLVEVYRDEAARQAHMQTPHFIAWRQITQDMFAGERTSIHYLPVFPPQEAWE